MENLTPEEKIIKESAILYAKKHKKRLAKELASKAIYKPETDPVSVFMAGSPGAGMASEYLIERSASVDKLTCRILINESDSNVDNVCSHVMYSSGFRYR
jgi:hypothetical protein